MGLVKFLSRKAKTTKEKLYNIVVAFHVHILWFYILTSITALVGHSGDLPELRFNRLPTVEYLFDNVLQPAIWEELAFRVGPLLLALYIGKALKIKETLVIPAMLISSAIFGLGHIYSPNPIYLQGAMGMVYSILYVKNNYSYWSPVVAHMAWNIFAFYIV